MSKNNPFSIIPISTTSRRIISSNSSFTLVELLIVIAILAMLASAVVLVLNPAELLAQARDSVRISEVNTMNRAINLFQVSGGTSLGPSNTVHVSLPDTSSTCINHSLPPLPSPWVYSCRTAENFRRIDGTGWIPINFAGTSGGSPIATLPVDPVNNTAHYYTYVTGGSFALSSLLESNRYLRTNALRDGGTDPGRIEIGTNLNLLTRASGLVGYWPLDGDFRDASGNNNNGTQSGGVTFTTGRQGQAGNFDGVNDFVSILDMGFLDPTSAITIKAWVKLITVHNTSFQPITTKHGEARAWWFGFFPGVSTRIHVSNDGLTLRDLNFDIPSAHQSWRHIVITYRNNEGRRGYIDGNLIAFDNVSGLLSTTTGNIFIADSAFHGLIDEVRIYNRALSPAEIRAIFNATR